MAERSPHQLMTRQAMSAAPWNDLPNLASPRPEKRIDKPGRPDEIGARIHSPTVRMTRKQTTPLPAKYPHILGLPEAAIDVSRDVSRADSDDAAHLFRSDRAHHSELMPPGRECLIDGLVCH
ncbi:MAG: hypothetical protein JNM03_07135 [Sphingopyxis sp.]|nr:hypothetical protein [Sphingopyxis sp.]